MGEKSVFSVQAHVFQIDPQTKKRWVPSTANAVRVSYYHDPGRKTFRIIAIENSKALVNSTVTASMNFTKTSPKFGQWSDHRANTVYGLGFSSEKDLQEFVETFSEAKAAAKKAVEDRKLGGKKAEDSDKTTSSSSSSPELKSPHQATPTSPPAMPTATPISPWAMPLVEGRKGIGEDGGRKVSVGGMVNGESGVGGKTVNGSSQESSPAVARAVVKGGSGEAQLEALRYENSRLKTALASSAQNVKKWEGEMHTLKSNNVKLTAALKESNQHVAEWKEKLQQYKEETAELKKKVSVLEEERGGGVSREECEVVRRENEELKEVLSAVQLDLEARQRELTQRDSQLRDTNTQLVNAKARITSLEEESAALSVQAGELEDQLHMAGVASRRKMEEAAEGHARLGQQLQNMLRLHQSLAAHYKL